MSCEEWRGVKSCYLIFSLSLQGFSFRPLGLEFLENEKSGTTCKCWVASQPDRQLLLLFPFIFSPIIGIQQQAPPPYLSVIDQIPSYLSHVLFCHRLFFFFIFSLF
jgi:hypothetical protein